MQAAVALYLRGCDWALAAERGFAWRPGSEPVATDDLVEIAKYQQQFIKVDEVVKRVTERGGITKHWCVNLNRRRAMSDQMIVTFNVLANGGFSPASYYRCKGSPNRKADLPIIEEAIVAFAVAVAKAGQDWSVSRRGTRKDRVVKV
jgi:hypothetical protein